MPWDFAFLLVTLNSLALLASFVYAYFKPKEWNYWLITRSSDYVAIYMLTFFLMLAFLFVFSEIRDFVIPIFAILFVIILWGAVREIKITGMKSVVPFVLYLSLMGQVIYSALSSQEPATAFTNLAVLYFAGILFIVQAGRFLGKILLISSPKLYEEHISLMKKNFGPEAPRVIRFEDGSTLSSFTGAHEFAGIGIAYCIWIVISFILLPHPLNPLEWGDLVI